MEVVEVTEGDLGGFLSRRGFWPLLPLVAEGDFFFLRVAEGDRRLCLSALGEGLFPRGGGFFLFPDHPSAIARF